MVCGKKRSRHRAQRRPTNEKETSPAGHGCNLHSDRLGAGDNGREPGYTGRVDYRGGGVGGGVFQAVLCIGRWEVNEK